MFLVGLWLCKRQLVFFIHIPLVSDEEEDFLLFPDIALKRHCAVVGEDREGEPDLAGNAQPLGDSSPGWLIVELPHAMHS